LIGFVEQAALAGTEVGLTEAAAEEPQKIAAQRSQSPQGI